MRRTFFVSSSSTFQAYPPDGSERYQYLVFISRREEQFDLGGIRTENDESRLADRRQLSSGYPFRTHGCNLAALRSIGRPAEPIQPSFVPVAANYVSSSGDNHNLLRFHPCLIFPAMIYDGRIIEQDTIRYDPFCIQRTERKCVTFLGNNCQRIYGCIADNSFYHRSFW